MARRSREDGPAQDPARGRAETPARDQADAPAEAPGDLTKRSWRDTLKRTLAEFKADNLSDWAAALTYYGVLSIFPAVLALVSILGVIGSSAIQPLIDNVGDLAPGPAREILTDMLKQLQSGQGAGLALVIGIAVALWSASGYVAAFMRASNAVYDIQEGRPIWKTLPTRVAITLALIVLLALTAIGVVFTGKLATEAGELIGLGDTAVTVWNIAKWPVMLFLVSLMIALLYWAAPNVKQPGFRWVTPGSLLAVLVWVIASAGFALYVANFSSYGKTYGSLASAIVFLIWLWISNMAILLGLELNSELERARAVEAGLPPDEVPYTELRDTRALPPDAPGAEPSEEPTEEPTDHRSGRSDRPDDARGPGPSHDDPGPR